MPELPEVETVVRTLETQIKNRTILDIKIHYKNIIENNPNTFKRKLISQTFKNFKRRGKYILFEMSDCTLVSHLRMEGKYFILDDSIPLDKHDHIIFYLDNGKQLRYNDVRKFGRMEIIDKKDDYREFKDLGPEPFDEEFNVEYCLSYLKDKKKPIKSVLLEQSFVAGIGNIYADEILFAIRIHPETKANKLKRKDVERLIQETRNILSNAIKAGGTTIRSYTSSLGVTGLFQLSLNVHTMKECPVCKNEITKIFVGNRGTYYCKKCQKKKR